MKMTLSKINDSERAGYILWRILAWVASIIVAICTILGWGGDDTSGWEIEYCLKETLPLLITCELEDGKYYYMALGRLIKVTDSPKTYDILYHLDIRKFTDILNCPKFKTKRQNRSEKLDKILFNQSTILKLLLQIQSKVNESQFAEDYVANLAAQMTEIILGNNIVRK